MGKTTPCHNLIETSPVPPNKMEGGNIITLPGPLQKSPKPKDYTHSATMATVPSTASETCITGLVKMSFVSGSVSSAAFISLGVAASVSTGEFIEDAKIRTHGRSVAEVIEQVVRHWSARGGAGSPTHHNQQYNLHKHTAQQAPECSIGIYHGSRAGVSATDS